MEGKIMKKRTTFAALAFLGTGATMLACGGQSNAAARQAAPKPTITVVSPQSLQSAIKKQRGKVVLVNFWATWCAPCVAELPGLAQLQKQFRGRGLAVILVSGDEPGSKALIAKTLAQRGHARSYLIGGDIAQFFDKFDPKFKGAIAFPRSYVYNRGGARVKTIENDHSAAQYARFVAPYL